MLWGIQIWKIVFVVISFPVLTGIGIITFQDLQDQHFESRAITPVNINQQKLSAARDLTSTWRGSATAQMGWSVDSLSSPRCTYTGTVTLQLTQQDNTLNGNFSWDPGSTTTTQYGVTQGLDSNYCDGVWGATADHNEIIQNGTVTSSSFSFSTGDRNFSGSFTSDLINGNFAQCTNNSCGNVAWETGNFKLTRQQN